MSQGQQSRILLLFALPLLILPPLVTTKSILSVSFRSRARVRGPASVPFLLIDNSSVITAARTVTPCSPLLLPAPSLPAPAPVFTTAISPSHDLPLHISHLLPNLADLVTAYLHSLLLVL